MMEIHAQNGRANGHANGDGYLSGTTRQRKAVIVGAGPVGCLAAIAFGKKGWSVEVYEARAGVGWFYFISHDSIRRLTFIAQTSA